MASSVPIRTKIHTNGIRRSPRRRRLGAVAVSAAFVAAVGVASAAFGGFNPFGSGEVGQTYNGALLLPTNQWISPIGTRIEDPYGADRLQHAQPRRGVHGGADLERVHGLPDDLRPEDGQDRPGRRRRSQHARPRGRRTRRRGRRRRAALLAGRKDDVDPADGRHRQVHSKPRNRHGLRKDDHHDAEGRERPRTRIQHRGDPPRRSRALGDGALTRRQQALRRPQRVQHARRDRHRDECG